MFEDIDAPAQVRVNHYVGKGVVMRLDDLYSVSLYHKGHGFPIYMFKLFEQAYEKFVRHADDAERFISTNPGKVASFLCHIDPWGFEPLAGHDRIVFVQWYYIINILSKYHGCTTKYPTWQVSVFRTEIGGKPENIEYIGHANIIPRTDGSLLPPDYVITKMSQVKG